MGIDIYAEWEGMTKEEQKAQYTGFDILSGKVGYLREAYHGSPYPSRILVEEAFESGEAEIPAAIMEERLDDTFAAIQERHTIIYKDNLAYIRKVQNSYRSFVKLCARKEKKTGRPCRIIASY